MLPAHLDLERSATRCIRLRRFCEHVRRRSILHDVYFSHNRNVRPSHGELFEQSLLREGDVPTRIVPKFVPLQFRVSQYLAPYEARTSDPSLMSKTATTAIHEPPNSGTTVKYRVLETSLWKLSTGNRSSFLCVRGNWPVASELWGPKSEAQRWLLTLEVPATAANIRP